MPWRSVRGTTASVALLQVELAEFFRISRISAMNKNQIEGNLKEVAGKVQQKNWQSDRQFESADEGSSEADRRQDSEGLRIR